jgi:hypothetical protein
MKPGNGPDLPASSFEIPSEAEFRGFQRRLAVWAVAWLAGSALLLWLAGLLARVVPWRGLVSIVVAIAVFSCMPPPQLIKLACGSYSAYPQRRRKMMEKAIARRGRNSTDTVRSWALFTKLLIVLFFGVFALFGFWLLVTQGYATIFLGFALGGLIPIVLLVWAWLFKKDSRTPEMLSVVAARIEPLRQLGPADIDALPRTAKEVVASPRGRIAVHTYHDVLPGNGHLIVVQALRDHWFGITTAIQIDGFVLDSQGVRRPLSEEETWPFL